MLKSTIKFKKREEAGGISFFGHTDAGYGDGAEAGGDDCGGNYGVDFCYGFICIWMLFLMRRGWILGCRFGGRW